MPHCKRLALLALVVIGLNVAEGQSGGAEGSLVDRIAVLVGNDVITLREILELESYLRYRRDHARSEVARGTGGGRLLAEAYEEAITRRLVLQKLRADPDFRLARSRAREEAQRAIQAEGETTVHARLQPYGLPVDRYAELEGHTVAIQDYVRLKLRHAILPNATQIQQYVDRHAELKRQFEQLSDEGREKVRELIARQLEFHNFLEQYEKFVAELRADVQVVKVYVPEAE